MRPPLPAACLPSGWGGVPSLVVQYPVLVVYSKFPRVPGLAFPRGAVRAVHSGGKSAAGD